MRVEVAQQLPGIVAGLEKKVVLQAVAPVFMELLTDPVEIVRREVCVLLRGVRSSALATFCVLNAAIEANNKQGIVFFFQIVTFAKSPKYNVREVFLLCCPQLRQLLSSRSFKRIVRPIIVMLASDPVACVRECVVDLILDEPSVDRRGS